MAVYVCVRSDVERGLLQAQCLQAGDVVVLEVTSYIRRVRVPRLIRCTRVIRVYLSGLFGLLVEAHWHGTSSGAHVLPHTHTVCRTPHTEQRGSQLRGSNVLRSPCSAAPHLPSSASSAPVRDISLPQASSLPCATSRSSLQCACK